MTKECECAAHSAVECCCGAWDEPQRPWVGLTDEERNTIGRHHAYVDNIIRATEAKLKDKNHA